MNPSIQDVWDKYTTVLTSPPKTRDILQQDFIDYVYDNISTNLTTDTINTLIAIFLAENQQVITDEFMQRREKPVVTSCRVRKR